MVLHPTPDAAIAACPPPSSRCAGVAVPDGTRPLPVDAALSALAPYLSGEVRVVVGLGLHRKMSPQELPASPWPLLQHDPDDTFSIGTFDGIPAGISRHFSRCEGLLAVGVVELHQYAGFSGGHKAVAVGCGSRATLDALHHRDRVTAEGVEIGRLRGNPFRAAVDAIGAAAGCRWALLGSSAGWLAGEPVETLANVSAALNVWETVPTASAAAVLLVKGRKAVNFYQASRALTYLGLSPRPPLMPGATLYLEAACPEGLGQGMGERAFAEVLRRGVPPWASLLTGEAPVGAGTQRAVMLALLLRKYRVVTCGVVDVGPFREVGLEATTRPAREVAPKGALWVADAFGRVPQLG